MAGYSGVGKSSRKSILQKQQITGPSLRSGMRERPPWDLTVGDIISFLPFDHHPPHSPKKKIGYVSPISLPYQTVPVTERLTESE